MSTKGLRLLFKLVVVLWLSAACTGTAPSPSQTVCERDLQRDRRLHRRATWLHRNDVPEPAVLWSTISARPR